MRTLVAGVAVVVIGSLVGCATTELGGREVLRLGPLRDSHVVPATVSMAPVPIDAGTNVLTDDELHALAAQLPAQLQRALDQRADAHPGPRVGEARVLGCRVEAGAGRALTLYEARCRVAVLVDGTAAIEVHSQALRRTRSRLIDEDEARQIAQQERNTLLTLDHTSAALESALGAAALLVAGDPVPQGDTRRPTVTLPFSERRRLAVRRYRLAAAGEGDLRAALHDLSSAGLPEDAALIVASWDQRAAHPAPDPGDSTAPVAAPVEAGLVERINAEIDAVGELCDPRHVERVRAWQADEAHTRSAERAVKRMAACAKVSASQAR